MHPPAEGSPQEAAAANFPGAEIGKQKGHGSDLARAHMKALEGLKYHRVLMI